MPSEARDLATALARQAPALALELLPAGHREGAEWRCGSLAGEPGQSLGMHLFGPRAGVWCDFTTGESGDALDLVAAIRFGGRVRDAIAWGRAWLGRSAEASVSRRGNESARAPRGVPHDDDGERRRRRALGLFLSAPVGLRNTPAASYLASRGIDLGCLGRAPGALRFHPAAWCGEVAQPLPAMLAAIIDGTGRHVATHRTWLSDDDDAGGWGKAALKNPKMTLGSYAGGFIPLQRGGSGKAIGEAPEGETVAIAEGIETALSVALACPELRVLAAVSLGNMARIALPRTLRFVILCADNDAADNETAARALRTATARLASEGRQVRVARPPIGKDFNDTLLAAHTA
jgi:hypothetical protein